MPAFHSRAGAKLAVIVATVFVVSCGGPSPSGSASPASHFPVTVTASDGTSVTITREPRHIVSLSPTATEMLFAIGAGPQVIAVDDQSDYPAGAPKTRLSGFQPNLEAIAAYTPDLVIASDDTAGLVKGMQSLNVPVLIEPAATKLDDSYAQIQQLGTVTGHPADADALVTKMRAQIKAFVALVGRPTRQLKVYHELDNTYYSATSATFIGQMYTVLGLTNIADAAKGGAPDYPQLSAEYIVSSNPDLIVLADTRCCNQSLATVAARPGWGVISAVRSGQVVEVDDDIASRWGPRLIDFLQAVAPHVQQLEKQAS